MAGEAVTERLSSGCCKGSLLIQSIFALIWTAISIALIVVGAIHKNECPEEPYIPIYMIVAGAFSFAFWLLLPLECFFPTVRKILTILIALFLFAWFIAGSVWVFRIYNLQNRHCHTGMYLFVFSILIIQYIFIGLGIIASLISCLCCENSCFSGFFNCFESCSCLESCKCLQCCNCLQCCKNIQCSRCLQCNIEKA